MCMHTRAAPSRGAAGSALGHCRPRNPLLNSAWRLVRNVRHCFSSFSLQVVFHMENNLILLYYFLSFSFWFALILYISVRIFRHLFALGLCTNNEQCTSAC